MRKKEYLREFLQDQSQRISLQEEALKSCVKTNEIDDMFRRATKPVEDSIYDVNIRLRNQAEDARLLEMEVSKLRNDLKWVKRDLKKTKLMHAIPGVTKLYMGFTLPASVVIEYHADGTIVAKDRDGKTTTFTIREIMNNDNIEVTEEY